MTERAADAAPVGRPQADGVGLVVTDVGVEVDAVAAADAGGRVFKLGEEDLVDAAWTFRLSN